MTLHEMTLHELTKTKNIQVIGSFVNDKGETVLELLEESGVHYLYNSTTKELKEDK